ncbi:hypothetical protein M422DRAFT_268550 [Sphaerobolus stellatus SS14]|uniref:Uncharacterized protein n=1 Tax=Sphaerobolus stellatus (strain SS14) TaxID=990650 RepID=A0A0C9UXA9_SPHS4|nr:hypothetical protein M422DRAFT_268550 [Sphaerobolus stellatus SS14]
MSHRRSGRRMRAEELSAQAAEGDEPIPGLTVGDLTDPPSTSVDPQQSPEVLAPEHPDELHAQPFPRLYQDTVAIASGTATQGSYSPRGMDQGSGSWQNLGDAPSEPDHVSPDGGDTDEEESCTIPASEVSILHQEYTDFINLKDNTEIVLSEAMEATERLNTVFNRIRTSMNRMSLCMKELFIVPVKKSSGKMRKCGNNRAHDKAAAKAATERIMVQTAIMEPAPGTGTDDRTRVTQSPSIPRARKAVSRARQLRKASNNQFGRIQQAEDPSDSSYCPGSESELGSHIDDNSETALVESAVNNIIGDGKNVEEIEIEEIVVVEEDEEEDEAGVRDSLRKLYEVFLPRHTRFHLDKAEKPKEQKLGQWPPVYTKDSERTAQRKRKEERERFNSVLDCNKQKFQNYFTPLPQPKKTHLQSEQLDRALHSKIKESDLSLLNGDCEEMETDIEVNIWTIEMEAALNGLCEDWFTVAEMEIEAAELEIDSEMDDVPSAEVEESQSIRVARNGQKKHPMTAMI